MPRTTAPTRVAEPGASPTRNGGMGRNLAIGCGVVFLLLFLAGAGVAWWFIGRPAGELLGSVRDVQRIEQIRDGVRDQGPYAAPADAVLEDGQVDRFLAVQDAMRERLEGRVTELRERYERIEQRAGDPTPRELAQAASDVTGLLVEATRAQVDALNAQRFSLEEYRWVRARVLEAAGYAAAGYDVAQLTGGDAPPSLGASRGAPASTIVPQANVDRVEPHRERIEENLVFARFGL